MKKDTFKTLLALLCGVFIGAGLFFLYTLRFHTYLGDDPATCVNCHIMAPFYATWMHSSHGRDATCNDCHVPHENAARKWAFKGTDGIKHTSKFVTGAERDVITANPASSQVIMNNCIRCHEQLTNEFIKDGRMNFMKTQTGDGKACWDCHRDVPHGGGNSLASTPNALIPYPESPVPEWLQGAFSKRKNNNK